MIHVEGYHKYIGGCSANRGDTISTSGGYHEYIDGDIMSTSGGYHENIGDVQYIGVFSIEIERILSSCSPTCIIISLRCTEHTLYRVRT